jgi:hypothetical protein
LRSEADMFNDIRLQRDFFPAALAQIDQEYRGSGRRPGGARAGGGRSTGADFPRKPRGADDGRQRARENRDALQPLLQVRRAAAKRATPPSFPAWARVYLGAVVIAASVLAQGPSRPRRRSGGRRAFRRGRAVAGFPGGVRRVPPHRRS